MFIKFQRATKYYPKGLTNQRLAAARRKLQREQDALPLFADEIAEQQSTAELMILSKDKQMLFLEVERRKFIADNWRLARRILKSMPNDVRLEAIEKWHSNSFMPKTAIYMMCMLHTHFYDYYIRHK